MAFEQTSFQPSQLAFFVFFLYTVVTSATEICPKSNFTVAFLHDPPYVKSSSPINSTKKNGLLYDFVQSGLNHCFHQYNCDTKAIDWRAVFSEDRLSSVILDAKADVAIPITPSLSSSLTEELTNSRNHDVTLVTVVKSPGLAMVIDYHACKMKIEKLTTSTILSAWPVCAVMLLLAGISGISIWALVSDPIPEGGGGGGYLAPGGSNRLCPTTLVTNCWDTSLQVRIVADACLRLSLPPEKNYGFSISLFQSTP